MQDDRIDYINPTPEESAPQTKKGKKSKKSLPGKIITGEIFEENKVRSHYPFALYCCVLIVAYIAYVFHYQHLQRTEIGVKIELQEERSRAMVFSSMRMNVSRHSNIISEQSTEIAGMNSVPTGNKRIPHILIDLIYTGPDRGD